jgi:hypothetical protein
VIVSAFPSTRLTGRWRYRVGNLSPRRGWFARMFMQDRLREALILQVEESYLHTEFIGGQVDCETRTRWRDAGASDVLVSLPCMIRQAGDSSWCGHCGLRWDTNDSAAPRCEMRRLGDHLLRGIGE